MPEVHDATVVLSILKTNKHETHGKRSLEHYSYTDHGSISNIRDIHACVMPHLATTDV